MESNFLRVEDVMELLSVSKSHAYKLMRSINKELKTLGYMTISGRVDKQFFIEKFCYHK